MEEGGGRVEEGATPKRKDLLLRISCLEEKVGGSDAFFLEEK